jgi:hypothetical protein
MGEERSSDSSPKLTTQIEPIIPYSPPFNVPATDYPKRVTMGESLLNVEYICALVSSNHCQTSERNLKPPLQPSSNSPAREVNSIPSYDKQAG